MTVSLSSRIIADLCQTNGWICGTTWMPVAGGYLYSQRLSELRHQGVGIESRKCQQHSHKVFEYRLVREPKQLALIA